jgi:6-phospho-beta-glucosidase
MKIAVIGAGSSYTPELLNGLASRAAGMGIEEVALQDPSAERLAPVAFFCRRLMEAAGASVRITEQTSLDDALQGADFVIIQIRIGGQEGRHEDIQLGLRHGLVGQETTGVGGFAKALRTVPAVLEIARRVDALCPDAWILNFTNPAGLVTEALLQHGREKCVGLCNVPIEMHMEIAKLLGRPPEDVSLDWVGLNHLGWVRRVLLDGKDMLPGLMEAIDAGVPGPANVPEIDYPKGFLKALGMIPSSYVRYFYMTEQMLGEIKAKPRSRAQEVAEIEKELAVLYADPSTPTVLPELLSKRGGAWYSRLAVDVLEALASDEPTVHIVNARNGTAVRGLPEDCTVEVPCSISRKGVFPHDRGEVEDSIAGLIAQVKSYERLAVRAAVDKDRDAALLALANNPLTGGVEKARAVLDDIIARGLI